MSHPSSLYSFTAGSSIPSPTAGSEKRVLSAIKSHRAVRNDVIRALANLVSRTVSRSTVLCVIYGPTDAWRETRRWRAQGHQTVRCRQKSQQISIFSIIFSIISLLIICILQCSPTSQKSHAHCAHHKDVLHLAVGEATVEECMSQRGTVRGTTLDELLLMRTSESMGGDWVEIGLLRHRYTGCLRPIPGAA
ncbi:hypothetical protein FB451DRAFT_1396564 [Mycena latifolia]|nr:hypothetical protein FB451DRAFT_1396564 [Mycena latifolia]